MEPIKLEFIVKGDIEKELAKVQLAIKGVGDESYLSFKRLLGSSNEAFSGLNRSAQVQAVSLQKVIQQLRQNEAAQEALLTKFKQGKVTSEEYATAQSRLSVQMAELKQQASDLNRSIEREIQLNRTVSGSLQEKRMILQRLREEYAQLNKEERENEKIGGQLLNRIRELGRELKSVNGSLKETKDSSVNLTDALEQIPGPIGSGVSQFKQLLSVGKSFMSSGVGIFVAGLTALFYGLKTAIEGSESATVKLNAKFEYFKSIYSTQKKMLTESVLGFYELITGDIDAANKSALRFRDLQMNQVGYAKASAQAYEEQIKINRLQERNNDLVLANTTAIEQYRTQLMDVNKTFEERKKIGQEILKLEKENANLKLEPIEKSYINFLREEPQALKLIIDQYPNQIILIDRLFKTLYEGGELTLGQQHDLLNAINDITAGLDRSWGDDKKAKFRSYFTDALDVTKDYYSKSREVSTNLSNIIKQQANEAAKANKKTALQKLQEEVKLYKEQYAILYAYERNMGKEAADEAFKDLKTKGGDFIAYLSNKINELKNKTNRTKDDDLMLGYLQKTRQEAAPKFDASAFKNSIEEKKKLYKQDIDGYADYLEKLRRLMDRDTSKEGPQKRIIIDLAIKDVKEEQQKNLDDLLKNYQTFTIKMTSLEKSYQLDMERLNKAYLASTTEYDKKRYSNAMDARTDTYQAELATLLSENSGFTQVLFGDMERVSRATLKKAIVEAKQFVEEWKKIAGSLSPEMKALLDNIEQGIRSAEEESGSRLPQDLQAVASALQDCATMAEAFDSRLGDVVRTAADVAQAAASIAAGIAQISSGNIVQGVSGIVSGVAGFISGIGKRIQENKKIRQEYLQSLVDTYSKELEYNAILRERLRIQQQIGETALEYQERLKKELAMQQGAINREYKEVWGKLMGENYISGTGYKHGTWFRKAKTWNEYSSLAGKSYEEIESLYTQDKLDGAAKALFERLKALKEEGADVVDMMDQLNVEMKESWTGTTVSAISDSIAQGFLAGKRSAADFADDFRGLMRNAMMQAIQMKYLEAPLEAWYEKFAEASENGLTTDKIEELRRLYDEIIASAAQEAEAMEKITGVSLAEDAARTAAAKGIQSVSQDSFNEFMGSVNALTYITSGIDKNVSNIHTILYQASSKWIEIEENTRYCRKLEGMEKDLKEMKHGINSMVNNGILMRTR